MTGTLSENQISQFHEQGFSCPVLVMPAPDALHYNRRVFAVWRNSKRLTGRGSLMYV